MLSHLLARSIRTMATHANTAKPSVLVTIPLLPAPRERLLANQAVSVVPGSALGDRRLTREEVLKLAPLADGVLLANGTPADETLLDAGKGRIKCVSTVSVGYDHVDISACKAKGVRVGHTPGVLSDAVADTAVLLYLMVARNTDLALQTARAGAPSGAVGPLLGHQIHSQSTVGVVGLGRIGMAIADRVKAIGGKDARFLYTARSDKDTQYGTRVPLETLMRESDVVFVASALTPETEGLINARNIALMKSTAFIVNIARGKLIDTDALVDALREGRIAGAGLDVTEPEPLPKGHPLLEELRGKVVILPHIGSATVETREDMMDLAVDNLVGGLTTGHIPAEVILS